jgi:tRNA wybutosine-synthesizing protein 4
MMQVVIHEAATQAMDFTAKNFRYVTTEFGDFAQRVERGDKLYLRALSDEKPSEKPAMLSDDFPALAPDFVLPEQLSLVAKNLFSSVLRLSGPVNMWLHYDVSCFPCSRLFSFVCVVSSLLFFSFPLLLSCFKSYFPLALFRYYIPNSYLTVRLSLRPHDKYADEQQVMANVYCQIGGSKRLILFPPSDVEHLSFAPGASSSSVDVFSSLGSAELARTHPHEAVLSPGDVLFLPPLWLHTATPTSEKSIAVNVFFKDLDGGHYASGRDVYGNRDLGAYEKGRQDVARIANSLKKLPADAREFYLLRLADELRSMARG